MSITFDFANNIINLTTPHNSELLVQDLINAIRDIEDSEEGIQYPKIADTSGKAALGGSVYTGITCDLQSPWQLEYPAGSYTGVVTGGNLVGGLSGEPVKYTAGVQVKLIQSANATIVATASETVPAQTLIEVYKALQI